MAEIIAQTNSKSKKYPRSTKVDLTPMVDLGFLLITFFIFTTNMSASTALKMLLPKESNDSMRIAASGAITLLAGKDKVIMFPGNDLMHSQKYPSGNLTGLRVALLQTRQQLVQRFGNDDKMFVIIKPENGSSFGQVINLFDEMTICNIRRYSLGDLQPTEVALLQQ